jgi:hypothetical protein
MDITFTGIPDAIGEQQAKEWMAILVERFENAKLNQIKEVVQATEAAKTGIDSFRTANALAPKFSKVEEKEVVAPKEIPEGGIEDAIIRG